MKQTTRKLGWGLCLASALVVSVGGSQCVQGQVYFDDFDTNWDFTSFGGAVPPGGIWDGIHNPTSGGSTLDANITSPGSFHMGIDQVGWGDVNTSGPFLYKEVEAGNFRSVKAKISQQTAGFWSSGGVLARVKAGPVDDGDYSDEFMVSSSSFRTGGPEFGGNGASNQGQNIIAGARTQDLNTAGLTVEDLNYVRLDHLGGGEFETFHSANGVDWVKTWSISNPTMAGKTLQVGLWGADFGGDAGGTEVPTMAFDWAQIEVVPEPTSAVLLLVAGCGGLRLRRRR